MTNKTISQILRVIELSRMAYRPGYSVDDAYTSAVHRVAQEHGVAYQTIGDGCRRRLNLDSIDEFKGMLKRVFEGDSTAMSVKLKQYAPASSHSEIDHVLKQNAVIQETTTSSATADTMMDDIESLKPIKHTIVLAGREQFILHSLAKLESKPVEQLVVELAAERGLEKLKPLLLKL